MGQSIDFWDKNGTIGTCPKNGTKGQDNGTFVPKNRDICPHDVKKWDNFGTMSQKVGHGTDRTLPYNI